MIRRQLGGRLLSGASSGEYVDDAIVTLTARVFKHRPINVAQGNDGGPRLRPGGRIVNGELILDGLGIKPRETFGDLQGMGISVLEGGAGPEIGGLHDQ